jgi:ATP-dependent Lon protease
MSGWPPACICERKINKEKAMTSISRPVVNARPKAAPKSSQKVLPLADVELTEEQIAESYFKTMKDARTKDLKARTRALYASIDAQAKGEVLRECADSPSNAAATLQLCSMIDVRNYSASVASQPSDSDVQKRNKNYIEQLMRLDGKRPLKCIPNAWQTEIQAMRRSYPNAAAFLDLLEDMCSLASISDGVLSMPPTVLDGPPGSGKSVLTEEVAKVFSGGYLRISMAGMEMGSELGGSDPTWSQARIGKVFSELMSGPYANPVILLDEIDKTCGSDRFSPWAPLHDLLEPTAAKSFRDRCFDAVPIDASRILWIATSNDFSVVPGAIKSRFTVVHIPLPGSDQLQAIVDSVWARLQIANPVCASFHMPSDMHTAFRQDSPRLMGQRLLRACAKAAREGVYVLQVSHLPPSAGKRHNSIGFYP